MPTSGSSTPGSPADSSDRPAEAVAGWRASSAGSTGHPRSGRRSPSNCARCSACSARPTAPPRSPKRPRCCSSTSSAGGAGWCAAAVGRPGPGGLGGSWTCAGRSARTRLCAVLAASDTLRRPGSPTPGSTCGASSCRTPVCGSVPGRSAQCVLAVVEAAAEHAPPGTLRRRCGPGACSTAPAGGRTCGRLTGRPQPCRRMPSRRAAAIHCGNSDSRRSYSSGSGRVLMSSTEKKPTLSTRRPGRLSKRSSTP